MSDFALFEQANNAMILGVTKNSDEMAEMFDIAQRLGRALGKDTAQSVESLVTGIGRQSRLMLDNIGIIVKSEEAYDDYAEELGITAEQLSDAQKKQAFLQATMESAREKVKDLGDEVFTTREKINQFTASSENLSVAIGEALSPVFGELALEGNSVLKNLTELVKIFSHTKSASVEYFETLERTPSIIQKYSKAHKIAVDSTKSLEFQLQTLMEVLSEEVAEEDMLAGTETRNALARTVEAYDKLIEVTKKYNESIKDDELKKSREEELSALEKAKKAIEEKKNKQQEAFNQELANNAKRNFLQEMYEKQLKLARERDKEELKEHLDEKLQMQDAYYAGITDARKKAKKELEDLQDEEDKKVDFTMTQIDKLSSALAQATLNGQHLGEAVVNSIKSIAVELASKAFIFTALSALGVPMGARTLGSVLGFAHTGGLIKDNGDIQRFAYGGQVQGQDNVPIMAQAGEFVIRKAVVEQVGVDNLARLNSGEGGAGNTINVNISGGVVDESYVNNELIPALNKASGLGNRINA